MVRFLSAVLLAFGLLAYMPVDTVNAHGNGRGQRGTGLYGGKLRGLDHIHRARKSHAGGRLARPSGVPELDGTAACGAWTLLAGGALVLGSRRRRDA